MPALIRSICLRAAVPLPVVTPMEMPAPQKTSGLWATPNLVNGWLPLRFTPLCDAVRSVINMHVAHDRRGATSDES